MTLPFFDRRAVRAIGWTILLAVFISGVIGGVSRGLKAQPDWRAFVKESTYAWQHREIAPDTGMFGYLPSTYIALWPFTVGLPKPIGLYAFVTVNVLASILSWWLLAKWWLPLGNILRPAAFVWPIFLMVGHFQHVLQANQFTIWVLALCVAGLTLLMKRRDFTAGLLLGLAGCIKVTPFAFAFYLIIRRQWRALAGMALAFIAFDILPTIAFFGADGAIKEHQQWARRVEWYSNTRFIEDPWLRVIKHGHNCSLSVVLTRWLQAPPSANTQVVLHGDPPPDVVDQTRRDLQPNEHLTLDPMPTPGEKWSIRRNNMTDPETAPRWHLASLSPQTVKLIWLAIMLSTLGALALASWKNRNTHGESLHAESALWLMMTLWPSPMMRDYYLVLILPAFVLVWRAAFKTRATNTHTLGRRLAIGALLLCYLGEWLLGWEKGNWYGLHLAGFIALALATAWAWRVAQVPENARTSP
jgi:hypothetical protein